MRRLIQCVANLSKDSQQLFLLKNFPPFLGNSGIFQGCTDLTFRNDSRCLGAFGLFHDPGEMLFISAPLVAGTLGGKNSLTQKDLSAIPDSGGLQQSSPGGFPWWVDFHRYHPKELYYILRELCEIPGFPHY